MTVALVNCVPTDFVHPESKFRCTFEQPDYLNWLTGDTINNIYNRLGASQIVYVVSEPPIDADPVLVADVRVRNTASGSQLPSSVADLINDLEQVCAFGLASVHLAHLTRLEQLSTTQPVLEQRSVVRVQALQDQAASGVGGAIDRTKKAASDALGGLKGIALATAVIVVAVAALWAYAEFKTARAA